MASSVYDRIRDAILSGAFSDGRLLSENSLAAEFGTSRTPVREALHRLEDERLISRGPRGAVVRATSPEEILDIYEVRITLEGSAADAAARRSTPLDLARLRARLQEMHELDTPSDRASSNRAFHAALWAASHSPTLVDLLERLDVHLHRYPTSTLDDDERWNAALAEHDALVDAIARADAAAARAVAEQHMSAARDVRLRMAAQA